MEIYCTHSFLGLSIIFSFHFSQPVIAVFKQLLDFLYVFLLQIKLLSLNLCHSILQLESIAEYRISEITAPLILFYSSFASTLKIVLMSFSYLVIYCLTCSGGVNIIISIAMVKAVFFSITSDNNFHIELFILC